MLIKILRRILKIVFILALMYILTDLLVLILFILTNNDSNNASLDPELSKIHNSLVDYLTTEQEFDKSGNFIIARNVDRFFRVRMSQSFAIDAVTLVTHCSANHLPSILDINKRWNGPLSLSVLVAQDDFYFVLKLIHTIMKCDNSTAQNIYIHMVIPYTDILRTFPKATPISRISCGDIRTSAQHYFKSVDNYDLQLGDYPNNLLRNIGLSVCNSGFVFVIDVDMLPNQHLQNQFKEIITRKPLLLIRKFAYVVPVFESMVLEIMNKTDLLGFIRDGHARPFYQNLCNKCHGTTNYEKWINLKEEATLKAAYEVSWRPSWEPFYILPWNAPKYDEQFRQYGFNRISHTCELHLSGYRFIILNKAFLLHNGFKSEQKFHSNKKNNEIKNRQKYNSFLKSMRQKYPNSSLMCK